MKQTIATAMILLLAGAADGVTEAFGPAQFLLIGAVVMAAAYILIRGDGNETQTD